MKRRTSGRRNRMYRSPEVRECKGFVGSFSKAPWLQRTVGRGSDER